MQEGFELEERHYSDHFSLRSGRMVVDWTEPIEQDEYEDMCLYFEILKRKIGRRVGPCRTLAPAEQPQQNQGD